MDTLARLPSGFWEWVGRTQARLLMLEYEGVVAPRGLDREQVLPHPRIYALLRKVAELPKTSVAIVSSWPARDLARFLPGLPIDLVGESGWELRARTGLLIEHPVPPPQARALAEGGQRTRARTGRGGDGATRLGGARHPPPVAREHAGGRAPMPRRLGWPGKARRAALEPARRPARARRVGPRPGDRRGADRRGAARHGVRLPRRRSDRWGCPARRAGVRLWSLPRERCVDRERVGSRRKTQVFLRCWLVATSPAKVGA
ncbi:MAG: hypothetical protein U1E76_27800 [Planctomycetota bacterium]